MVKIRVSYERPEELRRVLDKLGRDVKRVRSPRLQEPGQFRRAYIELKP